jgi:transposase InsO family protein
LYLAAILDLFSRRVVGHALSERIDRALVLQALRDAVGRHLPDADLLHHSDRGSQYASNDYQGARRTGAGERIASRRLSRALTRTLRGGSLSRAALPAEQVEDGGRFGTTWRRHADRGASTSW